MHGAEPAGLNGFKHRHLKVGYPRKPCTDTDQWHVGVWQLPADNALQPRGPWHSVSYAKLLPSNPLWQVLHHNCHRFLVCCHRIPSGSHLGLVKVLSQFLPVCGCPLYLHSVSCS